METITAQEELAFIRKVMEDSRSSYVDDGRPKILWGAIVGVGMLFTYAQALAQTDLFIGWVWLAISAIGWGYIFWHKSRREKEQHRKTYTGKIIGAIWGSCGLAIGLVIMLMFGTQYFHVVTIADPISLCPITAIIVGIAYFLDGTVRVVPWVRNLSMAWWASACMMFFWPSVHVLLIYAIMVLAFQCVPGIILLRKAQRVAA